MEAFIDNLLSPVAKKALIEASDLKYHDFCNVFIDMYNNFEMNAFAEGRPPLRLDEDECKRILSKSLYKYWNSNKTSLTVDICTGTTAVDNQPFYS